MFDLVTPPPPPPPASKIVPHLTLADRVNQALCWHDWLFHFGDDVVSMECQTCGKLSPGWAIDVDPRFR